MSPHKTLAAIAVAGLLTASGHAASHLGFAWPGPSKAPDQEVPPAAEPLHVTVEYKVEPLNAEFIRELIEIGASFSGVDPIDPESGLPVENLALVFRKIDAAYKEQPEKGEVEGTIKASWSPRKRGGGFVFEATGAQAVHDAVKIQTFEFGQVVAELTDHVAEVDGRLTYRSDLKLWELRLAIRSVATPANIAAPLEVITGSTNASLRVEQKEITTRIQKNEYSFPSAQLVLHAETKVEDDSPDSVRELFAMHATFASTELQPDPEFRALEDLAVGFGISFPGSNALHHLQIVIPSDLWVDGDGGGFKIEDGFPQSAGIQVLVVHNGQVVADRTNQVATFSASLRPDPNTKMWDLRLEIDGIIIPTDVHTPLFARAWGARLAMVAIGNGLGHRLARLAGAEATF